MSRLSFLFLIGCAGAANPTICSLAEAVATTSNFHVNAWRAETAKLDGANCTAVTGFLFSAHYQVMKGLEDLEGKLSSSLREESAVAYSTASTVLGSASSLLSAQAFGIGEISATRQDCLTPTMKTMLMVSLKHMKQLRDGELRALWIGYQGTRESFVANAGGFLKAAHGIFLADLEAFKAAVSGAVRQPDQDPLARMSIQDAMKMEVFGIPESKSPVLTALVSSGFIQKGDRLVDVSAGFGRFPAYESGLFDVDLYDTIPEIKVATNGRVQQLPTELPGAAKVILGLGLLKGLSVEAREELLRRIAEARPEYFVTEDDAALDQSGHFERDAESTSILLKMLPDEVPIVIMKLNRS